MNKRTASKIFLLLTLIVAASIFSSAAYAQCAMCKSSASNLDSVSARQLNISTLILLCPPVAIFCAIFAIAYKNRNTHDDES